MKRWHILDSLRGLTLMSMILYHGAWDMVYLFGHGWTWYSGQWAFFWQQSICWTFILLSGFCWHFGRKKLRRGLIVLAGSVIISLVTYFFMPESKILFGVLSFLGSAMILMIPLHPILRKIPALVGLVGSFLLFLLTRNVSLGTLGPILLPKALYRNLLTAYLGFPPADFVSSDYFPLLPWLFLFIAGYFLYNSVAPLEGKLPNTKAGPLAWLGRHSLIVYLLHQPVLYGILYVVHLF